MFTRRVFLTLLLILASFSSHAFAGEKSWERWYVIEMMGERAGWMHSTVVTTEERVTSTDETHIEISRAGEIITQVVKMVFVETIKGDPVSIEVHQTFGGQPTDTRYSFDDEGIREVTKSGTRSTEKRHAPIEGVWLTPRESDQYLAKRIEAGAQTVSLRTIDATTQIQPVMMTYSELEPTTLELLGRTVKAVRCRVVNSQMPTMSSIEYVDDRGELLLSETDLGAITIKMIAADKELALSKIDAPEMMAQLMIKPDRIIPGARSLKQATFVLTVPDGEMADLPETGSQRTERVDERTIRVQVNARAFDPVGEIDIVPFTESCTMLDTEDEAIVDLVKRSLDGVGEDPQARAEAMRRFVYRHVRTKSLGVGFASASEVARTREGDCSEHGTLLAAMLRVDNIPSRVVSGLVYVDEFAGEQSVFGYHLWTQALLTIDGEPRWVDLDATLPGSLVYDATHIALGTSSLQDGETVNGLLEIAPLMGRLKITVESLD